MIYILYNPLAGNGKAKAQELAEKLRPKPLRTLDVTTQDLRRFLEKTPVSERIILLGGDGTIHHFINRLHGVAPQHPIYYAPGGSGNDFMNDVQDKAEDGFILLNPYLENLPVVEAAGERRFFVNNVGFGIDGYCCEMGDQLRSAGQKNISYSGIAIKGLLGKYKPTSATITVDGETHRFDHVWLAPTMNGRYYGGGMKIAPEQDRLNEEKTVSVVALHSRSKLKTLAVFPSIFKGEHVRHQEMVSIFTGHEIAVTFDRPTALQIDGETIPGVSSYQVTAAQEQAANLLLALCAAAIIFACVMYCRFYRDFLAEKLKKPEKKSRLVLNFFLLCVWCAIIILCIYHRDAFSVDGIVSRTPANSFLAALVMLLLFALKSVSIVIYSSLLYAASGILFPLPIAILVNLLGTAIMATIPYLIGEKTGTEAMRQLAESRPRAALLQSLQRQNDFFFCLFARLIGLFPSDLLGAYMGASGIRYPPYLLGSLLGMLPNMITFPLMGMNIRNIRSPAFLISAGIQIAFAMVSLAVYLRYQQKHPRLQEESKA